MPRAKKVDETLDLLASDAAPLAIIEPKNSELDTAFDVAIQQAKDEIARIDERADFAISVVTQAIRTQASVAKGAVLLKLRERFDQVPALDGKWYQFLDEIEVNRANAIRWMNSARVVAEHGPQCGEDFLLSFSSEGLNNLYRLPTVIKEAVLEDAVETGKPPSSKEMADITAKPQTKLAKALEALEAKSERLEELNEGAEPAHSQEKYQLKGDTKKLEETIEQLKSQIAEDKIKAEQSAKETERLNAELELLKYDDEAAREQRVKRVGNTLIVQLPAVLSDLQKYVAEKDHYDKKVVDSLDKSIETLINYLKPLYA